MAGMRSGDVVRGVVLGALVTGMAATAAACGSSGKGQGATPSDAGAGDAGGSDVAAGGEAGPGTTTLSLPQLVHGVARVDTTAFPKIPLVVATSGTSPAAVTVTLDGANPVTATASATDATQLTATLDVSTLPAGTHALVTTATSSAGQTIGTATGSLVVATDSLQFTKFAQVGPAYSSHLVLAPGGEQLGFTWVSVANGTSHQLFLDYLDGAGARLLPADVVINDPGDEPLTGYTAFSGGDIGVVYNVAQPAGSQWLVKMRVVDSTGTEKVPVMDLTQGEGAFSLAAAGADPTGFSAAWLHIRPLDDAGATQPVEIRYARYDMSGGELVGPIVLDSDQPQATGSTQGPQTLEPLAEMGIACNQTICLVLYSRDVYNAEVDLNVAKLFVATVSLASGQLVGSPKAVETTDWDMQMFGQEIVALADGSFILAYTAVDTAAAITPITACDSTLERDLLFTVKLDATGALQGTPQPVFDFQGSREYPRIAPHPAGWALFWEDQRSECDATGGHIGMAMNVAAPDLQSLLDPYLEATGSIGLPPEYPSLAVTGTSFVAAWSDDRDGMGLAQPEPELFLETYWR
jgi:hypothetical protein